MNLKLGKLKPQRDRRNLKLARFIRVKDLPPIPPAYDYEMRSGLRIPLPMFANDAWGCCVIAGRAHQTLRFEATEQRRIIRITDEEVLTEYWREQGGDSRSRPDNGLYLLNSLKAWRRGWRAGGQTYDIYAFAELNREKEEEVKAAIYLLDGVYCGLWLPQSAEAELARESPWLENWDRAGGWGGHCVYVCGYSSIGPTCVTWGRKQLMSWEFWRKYCDEAYGIVDNRDRFMANSPLDVEKLDSYLRKVTA